MASKVGIVMPCINLWTKYTLPALISVATAQRIAAEKGIVTSVLLIDNASRDETQIEASTRAGIEYHRNEDMWGFQKSVNFGVNRFLTQGYEYVFVLNNDIVLHTDAIWRLVERMDRGDVHMATCLDVTGECLRIPENILKIDSEEKAANCPENLHPCFSAFMINRECWEMVGEFDEVFFPAYYEDNDYHYRMQLTGLFAITYPPAMFFHWGSATQLEALSKPLTDSSNQHAQYIRKWGGDPTKEQFKLPYNDESKFITSVAQH